MAKENFLTNLIQSKQVASVGVNVELSKESIIKLTIGLSIVVLVFGLVHFISTKMSK